MAKIRVVIGGMSAMLGDALSGLIGAQPDMRVVESVGELGAALKVTLANCADVLIVQGARAPEPLASVIAAGSLGLLVIDSRGHSGALTCITAVTEAVNDLSGERLLSAVRSASIKGKQQRRTVAPSGP